MERWQKLALAALGLGAAGLVGERKAHAAGGGAVSAGDYAAAVTLATRWRGVFPRVPLALALAVMREESRFSPTMHDASERAETRGGAYGLMGMTAETAADLYPKIQTRAYVGEMVPVVAAAVKRYGAEGATALYNPQVNALFGFFYLDDLLGKFKGNTAAAIAAYHGGPGRVRKALAHNLPVDAYMGDKTKQYLAAVTAFQKEYA